MSSPINNEEYEARYAVTKHHMFKGKYTRLFCIGRDSIATINPSTIFKVTNKWAYNMVVDITPVPNSPMDIKVSVRVKLGSNKTDDTVFTCQTAGERAELLTDVQAHRVQWDNTWAVLPATHHFKCRKYTASEEWRSCEILANNIGIQIKAADGMIIKTYYYMHISAVGQIEDKPDQLVFQHGRRKRLHLFQVERKDDLVKLIDTLGSKFVGVPPAPRMPNMPAFQFDNSRLGINRDQLASTADFPVLKISPKHQDAPVRRNLCTTVSCIVERDPASYNAINVYHLADVFALIRCEDDAQMFLIEYKNPHIAKTYTSPVRDALLAHLVDSCRSIGNTNVSVIMHRADRGKRASPVRTFVSDEIESTLLKCLIEPQKGGGGVEMRFHQVVEFFNANVEYSGLRCTENKEGFFAENREKLIFGAFTALLDNFPETDDPQIMVQQFYALRRLSVTRIGFSSAAIVPSLIRSVGGACVKALRMHHNAVSHAVMDFLSTLMTPHHDNFDIMHEQINKNRMLASDSFVKHLLQLLLAHTEQDSGSLVIQSLLDFFVYSLCPPYSQTTDEGNFQALLAQVVNIMGKPIFGLFQHTCKNIQYNCGMIIRVIMEEGDEDQFFSMQRAALSEGGFLRMFHCAAYLGEKDRAHRDLSRNLISLWTFENTTTQDLMRRMLPVTLLHFLQSKDLPPEEERSTEVTKKVAEATDDWRETKNAWFQKKFNPAEALTKEQSEQGAAEQIVYRQREVKVVPSLNWPLFFYQLKGDHTRPDLIWNHNTRNELKEALEGEMAAFQQGLELRKERAVCWNHQELEIQYPSLADELKIGNHYPRLLFESKNPEIARPKEFFNDMYHRFLLVQDFSLKCQCLQGMALLYEHYAEDIGQFHDIEFIIQMLETATHPMFRDRMLQFIGMLLRARHNVKPFINANGLKPLMDLLPLAHLHVDRPQIHTATGAIEGAANMNDIQDQEKEWHYSTKQGEKQDPISYAALKKLYEEEKVFGHTKVWAQGLGGWKDLKDVPQLKWGIMAKEKGTMTLSELSCCILDTLLLLCAYYPTRDQDGSVMQPLPRVKRYLSEPAVLPHIVQLLLTFEPSICSRVNRLVFLLAEDNPLIPRFFLNGLFFFTLMYQGSDIIPLCRLLHLTHRKQSFNFQHDNEIIRSSVLSPMLPPALVCFLHNHGPEKFAGVFLGEFETPEAIWGKDMRRYLCGKIATHISDFTPRLFGNIRVVYQYCPIVAVEYEQLANELFCSQYYLRHLCDVSKYPTWPIATPVELMRDTLKAWRLELEKEPSTMSVDKCYETLEIKPDSNPTPNQIRKAYFKLAAVYHPDKNPGGREMFEAIQDAYSFLASETKPSDGPDPNRISLLLRTQSILFSRFSDLMSEYKYAGYELLLRLLKLEFEDPEMLRKDIPLVEPATELCYHTVGNQAWNADELMQEGGFDLISQILDKAAEQITPNSTDKQVQTKVAANIIKTFGVATRFPECAGKIFDLPSVTIHASRCVAYEKAPQLSKAAVDAAIALSSNDGLQDLLTRAGTVWHCLLFIFRYDVTLEDSGVDINEENHTQLFANRTATAALRCLYALAGYRPTEDYAQTKPNLELHKLLQNLLTPFIVKKMRTMVEGEGAVLKYLNSNYETPYFLWNNTSRAELRDFCAKNSEICRDTANNDSLNELPPMNCDNFEYSIHSKELMVGGVFLRIYIQQPQFKIEDPNKLMQDIVTWLQDRLGSETKVTENEHYAMVMESSRHLLVAYPIIHTIVAAFIHVILEVLRCINDVPCTMAALEFLAKACGYPQCIEAVGAIPSAFSAIIMALERGEKVHAAGLSFIHQLLTDTSCVQQFLDRGMYVVLLHIFGTSRNPENKEEACVCMSKACADKLNGPKVRLRSMKLIPPVFLETMKENPTQCCQMFETWQENPELVWNADHRDRCVEELSKCKHHLLDAIEDDPACHWKVPDEIMNQEQRIEDIQVGDVYLTLFIKQPNWGVRHPRDFLIALLEKYVELAGGNEINAEVLELVADSTQLFLAQQSTLVDQVVALGYIEKLFKMSESPKKEVSITAVKILHEVCSSKACVESMNRFDPVASIMIAMEHFGSDVGLVMDTLERIMSRSSEKANMVKLALNNKLIQKLLQMLETGMVEAANAASARALVVSVIKAIVAVKDPVFGDNVKALLKDSSVWAKYETVKVDLFITRNTETQLLTGPAASSQPVLSLMAPQVQVGDDEPPPLD